MKRIFISFLISFFLLVSCSDGSDKPATLTCEKQAELIDNTSFSLVNTENYIVTNVALNVNCLDITVSSSGCNANNWTMNLFSTNNFPDTFPEQRSLKIELINGEACLAVFSKTVSFDLTPFQVAGQNQVTLNIEGWNPPIVYQY